MYLTVLNLKTRKSVPFKHNEYGEIQLTSSRLEDDPDNCIVSVTKMFHEYSQDYQPNLNYKIKRKTKC